MNAIRAPVEPTCYCYPCGNQTGAMRTHVAAGFTLVPGLWTLGADPFQSARLDANDLPHCVTPIDYWAAGGRVLPGVGG